MLASVLDNIWYYADFYRRFFVEQWADIGPAQYGTLLIVISVIGVAMMKSGAR